MDPYHWELRDQKTPIEKDRLTKIAEKLTILLEQIKDILDGKRWEDIPIDWAGFK